MVGVGEDVDSEASVDGELFVTDVVAFPLFVDVILSSRYEKRIKLNSSHANEITFACEEYPLRRVSQAKIIGSSKIPMPRRILTGRLGGEGI
jgi:hypothetical protein